MNPAHAPVAPLSEESRSLLERLGSLLARERGARAAFVAALVEVEDRRLHLELGHPSLFALLVERFGLSNASAYRRITAARLARRIPAVLAALERGAVSLTKVCALKDVLAPENAGQLLGLAARLSERDVEALAQGLRPGADRPAPRDSIRPLPSRKPQASSRGPGDLFAARGTSSGGSDVPARESTSSSGSDPSAHDSASTRGSAVPPAPGGWSEPGPPPPIGIDRSRHVVQMTVGPRFLELLTQVRAALAHSLPGAGLEELLGRCMEMALAEHARRSRAQVQRPRDTAARSAPGDGRHVPAAVRRAVWERDAGRCTFRGAEGRVCASTYQVELHHRVAFCQGGAHTVENLTLRCRAHNDLEARHLLGNGHMDRFTGRAGAGP